MSENPMIIDVEPTIAGRKVPLMVIMTGLFTLVTAVASYAGGRATTSGEVQDLSRRIDTIETQGPPGSRVAEVRLEGKLDVITNELLNQRKILEAMQQDGARRR